jgi:hypothetical protein
MQHFSIVVGSTSPQKLPGLCRLLFQPSTKTLDPPNQLIIKALIQVFSAELEQKTAYLVAFSD